MDAMMGAMVKTRSGKAVLVFGFLWAIQGQAGQSEVSAAAAVPSRPPDRRGTLSFINGDQIRGSLHQIANQRVEWRHLATEDPVAFDLSPARAIEFEGGTTREAEDADCLIHCDSGDELRGRLIEVTADSFRLATSYAGLLEAPRSRWQWIVFDDLERHELFSGPKGLAGWTLGDVSMARTPGGKWSFHKGAFYAAKAASIARDFHLPGRARIEFDLDWKGTLNLAIALYTDYMFPVSLAAKDSEPGFGGFYSLQLNSYFANVLMVKQKVPLQYLGQVQTPMLTRARKAHVDVRVDARRNLIALLLDGRLVHQWIDRNGFAGGGTGIRLVHQGQGSIRFSRLKVTDWDGQFEDPPENRPASKEDLVTLRNGDKLLGEVLRVRGDAFDVDLLGQETAVAVRKVKKIEFGGLPNRAPGAERHRVLAVMEDGGRIWLDLNKVESGRVYGRSGLFGEMDLDVNAIRKLEFAPIVK